MYILQPCQSTHDEWLSTILKLDRPDLTLALDLLNGAKVMMLTW